MSKPRITIEQDLMIRRMYAEKHTYEEISEKTGVSITSIVRRLNACGLRKPIEKHRKLTEEQISQIRTLSEMRLTQADIAERVGVSLDTVRRHQRNFGIPASNRWQGGFVASSFVEEPKIEKIKDSGIELKIEDLIEEPKIEEPELEPELEFNLGISEQKEEPKEEPKEEHKEELKKQQVIMINKVIEIMGATTGITYSCSTLDRTIAIGNEDVGTIRIPKDKLEAFVDELISMSGIMEEELTV